MSAWVVLSLMICLLVVWDLWPRAQFDDIHIHDYAMELVSTLRWRAVAYFGVDDDVEREL